MLLFESIFLFINFLQYLINSFVLLFLNQMTVLICLRYLQTSMLAVECQENMEIETEGYILEKTVKETVKEFKEKVLKLFQQVQVDAASSETEPEASAATPGKMATG